MDECLPGLEEGKGAGRCDLQEQARAIFRTANTQELRWVYDEFQRLYPVLEADKWNCINQPGGTHGTRMADGTGWKEKKN
ncbi:hypothetical protein MMC32_008470 [Xylographa parallela]|nr:hypothetical protein [Xylographa parallela]